MLTLRISCVVMNKIEQGFSIPTSELEMNNGIA